MRIFTVSEAQHYCSQFARSTGDSEKSIRHFLQKLRGLKHHRVVEGTALFQQYRDCSLRDVERSLFFAASHYRRSLDLMILSSAPWAHVTLYYGNWHASRALLGIFGCTLYGSNSRDFVVVDVGKGFPGQQELRLRGIGAGPGQEITTYKGSHRIFWDLFYKAVQSLQPSVSPYYATALSPIGGNPVWQVLNRNEVNYDSFVGLRLAEEFDRSFSKNKFPACLPGVLNTQFQILETLIEIVYSYARGFGLSTDALDALGTPSSLCNKVRCLIYGKKAPGLVQKTKKAAIT